MTALGTEIRAHLGDALYSFVQALLKVTDVSYLTRERVRSTFMEDFRALLSENVPEDRRTFDWHDPQHDPQGMYQVDCRINGMPRPLLVHALPSGEHRRMRPSLEMARVGGLHATRR